MKSEPGNGAEIEPDATGKIRDLLTEQSRSWPLLARGFQGLADSRSRAVRAGRYEIRLRHIRHRIVSTIASIDKADIAKRPCFLCAANLPPEQRGVPLNAEYTAYCNPFPIVRGHLTLVHRDHRWQAISGQIGALLDFTAALPDCLVIYNGPDCGASAPDHLHFQALLRYEQSAPVFPLELDLRAHTGLSIPGYGRRVFVARDRERERLIERVDRLIAILVEVTGRQPEPLLNIAAFKDRGGSWTVCVFPRGKHRPRVFETGELTVSPASVDLAGVFVVPVVSDYEKITGDDIARIFADVTLPEDQFNAALRQWESES